MVTVRYWAGARAAAGCAEESLAASTVAELIEAVSARQDLRRVLPACSLLVDGTSVRPDERTRPLPDNAVVDVLPPFAGG